MDARTPPNPGLFNKLLAVLVILGALNWGLIGFFKWNLMTGVLGGTLSQLFFILVGLAGLALAFTYPWRGKRVTPGATPQRYEPPRREVHP